MLYVVKPLVLFKLSYGASTINFQVMDRFSSFSCTNPGAESKSERIFFELLLKNNPKVACSACSALQNTQSKQSRKLSLKDKKTK